MTADHPHPLSYTGKDGSEDLGYFFNLSSTRPNAASTSGIWAFGSSISHIVLWKPFGRRCNALASGQPFTLLGDCRDWPTQSREVAEITNEFVTICRDFSIRRNAMIIPSALVRMQVRRTLVDFDVCEIFGTYEEADQWLAEVDPC